MNDVIEINNQFYILAESSLADDRAFVLKSGDTFALFDHYGDIARRKGFLYVASGPLVRSSYHASDFHPVVRR